MFSELVESVSAPTPTKKPWTMAASALVQCVCLAVLMLIPLLYTAALPKTTLATVTLFPFAPHRVQRLENTTQPSPARPPARSPSLTPIVAPVPDTRQAAQIQDEPPPEIGGSDAGLLTVIGGPSDISVVPVERPTMQPRPPAPTAPASPLKRVPVGGPVQSAKLIARIQPVYPPLAITARIEGAVVLRAIIAKDGSVAELQAVSGHPLLIRAALDAVGQWRYQPTLLNGVPVEVDTTITVSFVLGR